jgi:DNA-binding NtrC family response regulator
VKTFTRSVLERWGFEVLIAENGLASLEIIESRGDQIRLVLLDLTMPVMGGEETLDRIRAIHPEMPVIVMTGFDQAEASRRFANRRLHGFLQKPFTADELRKYVESAINP